MVLALQSPGLLAAAAPLTTAAATLVAGGAILVMLWAASWMRRLILAHAHRTGPSPTHPRGRGENRQIVSDADELATRLAARLDAKAAELERLIERADERIARLTETQKRATDRPRSLAAQPSVLVEHRSIAVPGGGADPLTRQVCQLADEGLPSIEIARRLDEQVGKVELILALRTS